MSTSAEHIPTNVNGNAPTAGVAQTYLAQTADKSRHLLY